MRNGFLSFRYQLSKFSIFGLRNVMEALDVFYVSSHNVSRVSCFSNCRYSRKKKLNPCKLSNRR